MICHNCLYMEKSNIPLFFYCSEKHIHISYRTNWSDCEKYEEDVEL